MIKKFILSLFRKEPELPAKEEKPVDTRAKVRPVPDRNKTQYDKDKEDQAKIKYKPYYKTQPGSLPVKDPYANYRHDVARTKKWISTEPEETWEGKSIEFLDYVVEDEDNDRLRKQTKTDTFLGSSQDNQD